jgi:UDP-sugar pyrophosphorylase
VGFVLVAGGLGERLGYSGIKLALPSDSSRGACFLEEYAHSILALQGAGKPLPLAIMTSPDTHTKTLALLESNGYFGLAGERQVTLLLQERVACLSDGAASLALDPADPFRILTKPHGHGDVHALLHSTGTARRWAREHGTRWVAFFQDTNVQAFRALPAAVGVAEAKGYAMVSVAVPRRAGEAIGALARLVPMDAKGAGEARGLTINVEYNQLDPLLRATNEFRGGDADDPATGFSPFPGNINQLVVGMAAYLAALEASAGVVGEFVNPKYKDPATRTDFKSPARLECMMQDLPHALDPSKDLVGFLTINQVWAAYSPVKNSLAEAAAKGAKGEPTHSAAAAEADVYRANCFLLSSLGARVGGGEASSRREFKGVPVELWPAVSWSPLFALTMDDLERRLRAPGEVTVSPGSSLVVRLPVRSAAAPDAALPFEVGSVSIEGIDLDGALEVDVHPGASLRIGGGGGEGAPATRAVVRNGGWRFVELDDAKPASEEARMRGFKVCKRDGEKVVFAEPGEFEYNGGGMKEEEEVSEEKEELAAVA